MSQWPAEGDKAQMQQEADFSVKITLISQVEEGELVLCHCKADGW